MAASSSQIIVAIIVALINGNISVQLPSCDFKPAKKGFSEDLKKTILELHNKYRQDILNGKVQGLPKAKEMSLLKWDKDLESEAQRWAEMCPDYHKQPYHPPRSWAKSLYGQNVAWGFSTVSHAITGWFNEYKPYVKAGVNPLIMRDGSDPEVSSKNLGQIGHFTQMVNAKANKIGCGTIEDHKNLDTRVIYVCNYSPPGNVMRATRDGQVKPEPAYKVDESKKSLSQVHQEGLNLPGSHEEDDELVETYIRLNQNSKINLFATNNNQQPSTTATTTTTTTSTKASTTTTTTTIADDLMTSQFNNALINPIKHRSSNYKRTVMQLLKKILSAVNKMLSNHNKSSSEKDNELQQRQQQNEGESADYSYTSTTKQTVLEVENEDNYDDIKQDFETKTTNTFSRRNSDQSQSFYPDSYGNKGIDFGTYGNGQQQQHSGLYYNQRRKSSRKNGNRKNFMHYSDFNTKKMSNNVNEYAENYYLVDIKNNGDELLNRPMNGIFEVNPNDYSNGPHRDLIMPGDGRKVQMYKFQDEPDTLDQGELKLKRNWQNNY